MYQIIESGSKANAIIYFDCILVDIGVSYARIQPYLNDIKLILLTHEHSDHLKINTIKKIALEHPHIRFGCGHFLADKLKGVRNVDVLDIGKMYDYGIFQITAVKLYHDVPNFGYRIFKDGKKIIHATDTCTLDGIEAKGYDLYAIEANYCENKIKQNIEAKQELGQYAYERGAINSHLSVQQAQEFVSKNAGDKYEFIMLHQSKNNF